MAARPGTVAALIEADWAQAPSDDDFAQDWYLRLTHYGASPVAAVRTVNQLLGCRRAYGPRSVADVTPENVCQECGALCGFVHPASCTLNPYPGQCEDPARTAQYEAAALGRALEDGDISQAEHDLYRETR